MALTEILGDVSGFVIDSATAEGDEILERLDTAPAGIQQLHAAQAARSRAEEQIQRTLDTTDIRDLLLSNLEHPRWENVAERCLSCTNCTMVCPTCSCFTVMDELHNTETARRVRTWDSCLFRDYAVVAGGHNFRADRADRVRNRYYHKQEAFLREFGMPSCVACGRCIENCPTGINVVEVFQHVRGDL